MGYDHRGVSLVEPCPLDSRLLHAKIFLLDESGFTEVDYEETEHYAVTKEFMNDPGRMVKEVLGEN